MAIQNRVRFMIIKKFILTNIFLLHLKLIKKERSNFLSYSK